MADFALLTEKEAELLAGIRKEFNSKYHSEDDRKHYLKEALPQYICDNLKLVDIRISKRDAEEIISGKRGLSHKGNLIHQVGNFHEACIAALGIKKELSVQAIIGLHSQMFSGLDPSAGRFREEDRPIYGSRFHPTDSSLIAEELEKLCEWYNESREKMNPFELAVILHFQFVSIFPFSDGNGRLARLLMNVALWQDRMPLFMLRPEAKKRYTEALEKSHHDGSELAFFVFMVEEYINGDHR